MQILMESYNFPQKLSYKNTLHRHTLSGMLGKSSSDGQVNEKPYKTI